MTPCDRRGIVHLQCFPALREMKNLMDKKFGDFKLNVLEMCDKMKSEKDLLRKHCIGHEDEADSCNKHHYANQPANTIIP
jgi:hypothetical protein